MFIKSAKSMHKNESGQAALETAIILIAFVVVASVFAFAILSAGSASTDKGKQAINAGLQGVQSSMSIKGSVSAIAAGATVDSVVIDLGLVAGGSPVDLTDAFGTAGWLCSSTYAKGASTGKNTVVVSYRDANQSVSDIPWKACFVGQVNGTLNNLLESGELAEMTIDLTGLSTTPPATKLGVSTAFTIEIKPPTGSVIKIDRTTPAAIGKVMELN